MSDPTAPHPELPHYLRFACAVALVSVAAIGTSGCEQLRERVGCDHCHCAWAAASWRQPLSCESSGPVGCCDPPIRGPLAPPDLRA